MKTRIRLIALTFTLFFVAIIVQLSLIQVVDAGEYRLDPGNQRQAINLFSKYRGPILIDGEQVARSIPNAANTRWQRVYPDGTLYASTTGFLSAIYGLTGIERYENPILSGEDDRLFLSRFIRLLRGSPDNAGAVILSIDPAVQQAAKDGLDGRNGAAVALDPQTGAILAIYSAPDFDPNEIVQRNASQARTYHDQLIADPDRPLLNRATSETYPPGSTFKLITAAAALESGMFTPETLIPGQAAYELPGSTRTLKNFDQKACQGQQTVTLTQALVNSCNTSFAWLGVELGASKLRDQATQFGFEKTWRTPLPVVASTVPTQLDDAQTAMSAIGQFDVKATAMQMAMVVSTIANKGQLLEPYLVAETLGPDLQILTRASKTVIGASVSPKTAEQLTEMMVMAVTSGTGSNAQIPGTRVAGKTGTAETGTDQPSHAWFVGFAPATNPVIAVAVIVEANEANPRANGNSTAAPIARSMMQARLRP